MKKSLFIILLAVVLVALVSGTALASSTGNLVSVGSASVNDCGNRLVAFTAFTYTSNPVEYLSGRIYLQRWNGSGWSTVSNHFYFQLNHFFAIGGRSVTVSPGYYRTYAIHYAEHQGVTGRRDVISNYIYIN